MRRKERQGEDSYRGSRGTMAAGTCVVTVEWGRKTLSTIKSLARHLDGNARKSKGAKQFKETHFRFCHDTFISHFKN